MATGIWSFPPKLKSQNLDSFYIVRDFYNYFKNHCQIYSIIVLLEHENNNKKLDLKKYSLNIELFLKKNNTKIIFEPGRSIVGNTGILISKITPNQNL